MIFIRFHIGLMRQGRNLHYILKPCNCTVVYMSTRCLSCNLLYIHCIDEMVSKWCFVSKKNSSVHVNGMFILIGSFKIFQLIYWFQSPELSCEAYMKDIVNFLDPNYGLLPQVPYNMLCKGQGDYIPSLIESMILNWLRFRWIKGKGTRSN